MRTTVEVCSIVGFGCKAYAYAGRAVVRMFLGVQFFGTVEVGDREADSKPTAGSVMMIGIGRKPRALAR